MIIEFFSRMIGSKVGVEKKKNGISSYFFFLYK